MKNVWIFFVMILICCGSPEAFGSSKSGRALARSSKNSCRSLVENPSLSSAIDEEIQRLISLQLKLRPKEFPRPPKQREVIASLGLSLRELNESMKVHSISWPQVVESAIKEHPEIMQLLSEMLLERAARWMKDHYAFPRFQNLVNLTNLNRTEFLSLFGSKEQVLSRLIGQIRELRTLAAGLESTSGDLLSPRQNASFEYLEEAQARLLSEFAAMAQTRSRVPTIQEWAAAFGVQDAKRFESWLSSGVFASTTELEWYFLARETHPKKFAKVRNPEIFSPKLLDDLRADLLERDRLVVTSVIAGMPVDPHFKKALEAFHHSQNARTLVIPTNYDLGGVPEDLVVDPEFHVLTHRVNLGPVAIEALAGISTKMINPLTGVDRNLKPKDRPYQSLVLGSIVQHAMTVSVPYSVAEMAPVIHRTTGMLSSGEIQGPREIQRRTDRIANVQGQQGALILEKSMGHRLGPVSAASTGLFHAREIEYIPEEEGFWDAGIFYRGGHAPERRPAEALLLSDFHPGYEEPALFYALQPLFEQLSPKYLVVEDGIDNHSVTQKNMGKPRKIAEAWRNGKMDMSREYRRVAQAYNALFRSLPPDSVIILKDSNHNDWLARWLNQGLYVHDPINSQWGRDLLAAWDKGEDLILFALRYFGLEEQFVPRLMIQQRGQSLVFGPPHRQVEVGYHGHEGSGGKPGSLATFAKSLKRAVFGHTHAFERLNGVVNVGCTTQLNCDYNMGGLLKWVRGLAAIGPHGEIQGYQFLGNEFLQTTESRPSFGSQVYETGYPLIEVAPEGTPVVDQYTRPQK